jgi:hypothetical protein
VKTRGGAGESGHSCQRNRERERGQRGLSVVSAAGGTQAGLAATSKPKPKFVHAVAFDTSKPLRTLAKTATWPAQAQLPPELGPVLTDTSYAGDSALRARPAEWGH